MDPSTNASLRDDRGRDPRARRRTAVLVALLLSLLLHVALFFWVDANWRLPGRDEALRTDDVSVALIPGAVVVPPSPAVVAEKPAPRPRPRPRAPPPSPTAITPPERVIAPPPALPPDAIADAQAKAEAAASLAKRAEEAKAGAEEKTEPAAPEPAPPTKEAEKQAGPTLPSPPTGHWRLRVYYGDYDAGNSVAVLDYRIALDGDRYRLSTEGRAEGLIALIYSGIATQTSTGRITAQGVVPERYTERRGNRPERSATVDWEKGEVSFSGGERAPVVEGMQDRLSVLVQLAMMARGTPERFAPGKVVRIEEITLRDTQPTSYTSRGNEILQTPRGAMNTLHLERTEPRGPDDPAIDVWLAYDLGMLPIRIRYTDSNARTLDQMIEP